MTYCHDWAIHFVVQEGPTTSFAGSQFFFWRGEEVSLNAVGELLDHRTQA